MYCKVSSPIFCDSDQNSDQNTGLDLGGSDGKYEQFPG